jgi:hypothetical protein
MATSGVLATQFDYSKLFIFNNKYRTAVVTNSSGSDLVLTKGMLMGRIYSSGKIKQSLSTATDGSQLPIGVLAQSVTIANGADATVSFCISGEVAREGITFAGSDGYSTKVYAMGATDSPADSDDTCLGLLEDWLWQRGIQTVASVENTKADNA